MTLSLGVLAVLFSSSAVLGFNCPSDGFFSDPANCGSFYQCNGGTALFFNCPPGLYFNPTAKVCDWPANVNCGSSQVTTGKPTNFPTTAAEVTTGKPTNFPTTAAKVTTGKPTNFPTTAAQLTTVKPTNFPTTAAPTAGCNTKSSEPITDEIKALRMKTCMASNDVVEKVSPGSASNPSNVKVLESIFSKAQFKATFPNADPLYTYENLLKAFAKFPGICPTAELCKRTLASMFAHFEQETAGLKYLKEINKYDYCGGSEWATKAYPCAPGKQYYGRGAKQLSWNYNYGPFSQAMYGDAQVLLKNPDLVSDTWLNFASALWFYVTPQPPKPSMMAMDDQSWKPNSQDLAGNRKPGFGASTMIINGALECGAYPSNPNASKNRQEQYKKYAKYFNIDISGEKLDCADMQQFDASSSANLALYWQPGCTLGAWQTPYSAAVEGDYQRCKTG